MRKLKLNTNRKYAICILISALIISQGGIINPSIHSDKNNKVFDNRKIISERSTTEWLNQCRPKIKEEIVEEIEIEEDNSTAMLFKITSYDLSLQSCGKYPSNPAYGLSRGGVDLKDQNYKTVRVVSVDPKVIPLGSKVRIKFVDENYKKYDFIYFAVDTGVKGKTIDLFLGDFHSTKPSQECINFGVTKAWVSIVK